MKKLLVLLFAMVISLPSFAGLKEKDVVGTWTYKVEIDNQTLTGNFKFEKKEGQLTGEVITDDGQTVPFTKVEIRGKITLYLELQPEYEVYQVTLIIENNRYNGTIALYDGLIPITGEKIE